MFDAIVADARDAVRCQLTEVVCNVSMLALRVVFCTHNCSGARGVRCGRSECVCVRRRSSGALLYATEVRETTSQLIRASACAAYLKPPKSELSDFSRPLRTPPEASEQKADADLENARLRPPTEASRTCRVDGVRGNNPCALDGAPALLAAATVVLSAAAAASTATKLLTIYQVSRLDHPSRPSRRRPRTKPRRP